ncbi:MAG: DNA helicase UvrD [Chloroflexi bacterium]|nr:DNA helicase UvrD [Chloroflexota bacterium]
MPTQRLVADLHLHSRYSMATSRALDLSVMAEAAVRKGIQILSAADFTHPEWRRELGERLVDDGSGLFRLEGPQAKTPRFGPRFVLGTEVSCVWRDPPRSGRGRRVHLLLFAPDFDAVDALIARIEPYGALGSDGRPLLKLSVHDLVGFVMDADERCEVIPAHVWTPWYGLYGSKSGFDSLEDAFGDHGGQIHAIETGLSSDPEMNWGVPELKNRALVSFSDAHSAANVGREATIFEMEPTYDGLVGAIASQSIVETIEFFPENGKYHLDGHRACDVRLTPAESATNGGRCPVCGRPLTLGVLNRIESLSDAAPVEWADRGGPVSGLVSGPASRPPFRRLVPLRDLVAACLDVGKTTKTVARVVDRLVEHCGSELNVLIDADPMELRSAADDKIASAIISVRRGDLAIEPGYDGVYGRIAPRSIPSI